MTLATAIYEYQRRIALIPGIKGAPAEPPENMNAFPFVIAYAGAGTWAYGTADTKKGLLSVVVELHIARKNLPTDTRALMGYVESIPNALLKAPYPTGIDAITEIDFSGITSLGYGGQDTIGFRWTINNIKMQSAIT